MIVGLSVVQKDYVHACGAGVAGQGVRAASTSHLATPALRWADNKALSVNPGGFHGCAVSSIPAALSSSRISMLRINMRKMRESGFPR